MGIAKEILDIKYGKMELPQLKNLTKQAFKISKFEHMSVTISNLRIFYVRIDISKGQIKVGYKLDLSKSLTLI